MRIPWDWRNFLSNHVDMFFFVAFGPGFFFVRKQVECKFTGDTEGYLNNGYAWFFLTMTYWAAIVAVMILAANYNYYFPTHDLR